MDMRKLVETLIFLIAAFWGEREGRGRCDLGEWLLSCGEGVDAPGRRNVNETANKSCKLVNS